MSQISEWIPFHDELQRRLGDTLQDSDFELDFQKISDGEATLIYKRMPADSRFAQYLQFDGILWSELLEDWEEHTFNWLRVYAVCDDTTIVVKRFSPEFLQSLRSPDGFTQAGWIYQDEMGLEAALDEISEIVSTDVLRWFNNPSPDLTI
jgi:hypothetical protein